MADKSGRYVAECAIIVNREELAALGELVTDREPVVQLGLGQLQLSAIMLGSQLKTNDQRTEVDMHLQLTGRLPGAEFSECGRYRYLLRLPTGVDNDRIALGCFANPSTATAFVSDPTVTRWFRYCKSWGYGWSWVVNVRAWRETHPGKVPPDPLAIGPCNDAWILAAAESADLVVCGWGKLGGTRGEQVLGMLDLAGIMPHALHLNADGSPGHPLYLPKTAKPCPMVVP